MTDQLVFTVYGTPAPQGSKRHVGRGIMIESSAKVKPWREAVKTAALTALAEPGAAPFLLGPVVLNVSFMFTRPKSHYGTGRNANTLKNNAPLYVSTKPDNSKLLRSTEDALTDAGVWRDDAQAAVELATKTYVEGPSRAVIIVSAIEEQAGA